MSLKEKYVKQQKVYVAASNHLIKVVAWKNKTCAKFGNESTQCKIASRKQDKAGLNVGDQREKLDDLRYDLKDAKVKKLPGGW